jgi:hypothetical protein
MSSSPFGVPSVKLNLRLPLTKPFWKAARTVGPAPAKRSAPSGSTTRPWGNLIAEVDLEGRDLAEVVQEWRDANQEAWQPWTACAG